MTHLAPGGSIVPSYGMFYVVIAEIKNVEGQCRLYTV